MVLLASPTQARAVRPFITDDARVVGGGYLQLESWVLVDAHATEHWITFGFGPVGPLELTAGFVWGGQYEGPEAGPAVQGPLLQAKVLAHETRPDRFPGVAVVLGTLAPTGAGAFAGERWTSFAYLAVSQSFFGDDLLFHLNVGLSVESHTDAPPQPLAGFGFQARVIGPLALLGEIVLGDALAPEVTGGAMQVGYRLLFSEEVQLDGTFGYGLWGESGEWWVTSGIRLVMPRLYDPGPDASAP